MNEGLIQFLVIAFFVVISMMDAAARKRRKQAQSLARPPAPDGFDGVGEEAEDLDQEAEPPEGVAPEDIWKDIAALARGEAPGGVVGSLRVLATPDDPSSAPDPDSQMEGWIAPQQEMRQMSTPATEGGPRVRGSVGSYNRPDDPSLLRSRSADLQGGYTHPDQAASHEEHAHEKHAEVLASAPTFPAERPHEFVPHPAEPPSEPQGELSRAQKPRSLLSGVRDGTRNSLREAIILAEVLNLPVVLRDSDRQPPGMA